MTGHRRLTNLELLALAAVIAIGSCSDDTATPEEVTDPVYIWAGTGHGDLDDMGKLPRKTALYWPQDVIFAADGKPVIIDHNNHRVITLDDAGNCRLVAGGSFGEPCPSVDPPCEDILAAGAKLNHPTHVAFDAQGNLVLAAWHNSELFLIDTASGLMDRICGTSIRPCFGPVQNDPQPALTACVDLPACVAFDPQGRLCFTDEANMIIRRIDNGIVDTIAGTQPVWDGTRFNIQYGYSGDDGPAIEAKLSFPRTQSADVGGKICFDAAGNMYIADTSNHAVRVVDTNGIITRFAGAAPVFNAGLGQYEGVSGYQGDGGPATSARLNEPRDVAVDSKGNVLIADTGNHVIRMVSPGGTISTIVGVARHPVEYDPLSVSALRGEDGASAKAVRLTKPYGIAVDSTDRLWIADTENNVIRVMAR